MKEIHAHMSFVDEVCEAGIAVSSGSSLLYQHEGRTYLIAVSAFDVTETEDE